MDDVARKARIAAASVIALGVASVAIFSTYRTFAVASYKPVQVAELTALSQGLFATKAGSVAAPSRTAAIAALAQRPMDSIALAQASFAMAKGVRDPAAAPLMSELLRRDPRSMPARFWMLAAALKGDDVAGAIGQLDRIMVIDRYNADPFFPALVELAKRPQAEAAFTKVFAAYPPWRGTFLNYLTATGQNSSMVYRLAARAPGDGDGVKINLIQKLVDSGQYDSAYLAWVNFLPDALLDKVTAVYDGGFVGLPGPQPFNWTFSDSEAASVGLEQHVGLQVDYPATQSVRMAGQTLVLKPGRYRLTYSARGSGETTDGGVISWQVACLPTKAVILDFAIKGLGEKPSAHAAQFVVPTGCEAQTLSLEGLAGTFPQSRSVEIRQVSISVAS